MNRALRTSLVLFSIAASAAIAATPPAPKGPLPVPAEVDACLHEGLDALTNLRYRSALAAFTADDEQADEHPLAAFGTVYTLWLEMDQDVDEHDRDRSNAFLDAADRCVALCRDRLRAHPDDAESYLIWGSVSGLIARWEAGDRHWWAAYRRAKQAKKMLDRSLAIDPDLADAQMGLGMYDYYLATVPKVVRVLGALKGEGNKDAGLKRLRYAADRGQYTSVLSKIFLAGLLGGSEGKPNEAIAILRPLRAAYPESPLIHGMLIESLYNARAGAALTREAAAFDAAVASGTYPAETAAQGRFYQGLAAFRAADWAAADRFFGDAVSLSSATAGPYPTWAELYRGFARDAAGRRNEALTDYRSVLAEPPRWHSHSLASARLETPFKAEDKERWWLQL